MGSDRRALERHVVNDILALGLGPSLGLVAVSGGPDSLALLHLLAATTDHHHLALVVAHVDHGIHPESGEVSALVAETARRLGLPFEMTRLALGPDAGETEAREARYRWLFGTARRLATAAGTEGVVLTAHHRDDQVETILMRILRGTGPAGLAGMARRRDRIVRPLLGIPRADLEAYLDARGIPVWQDPAHRSSRHLRRWLRTEVLPSLEERLPEVRGALLALGRQAARSREAWDLLLDHLPLEVRAAGRRISFASGPLRAYDKRLSVALLMALARRVGLVIGPRSARRALEIVLAGKSGSRADLGAGVVAEVQFERVVIGRLPAPLAGFELTGPKGEVVAGGWRFRWWEDRRPGALQRSGWSTWLPLAPYRVRGWRPGDRIRPLGGSGSRLVVRCMQDQKVGRSDRPDWPIVSRGEDVLWVPGICRSELADPGTAPERRALRIDVERE